MDFDATVKSIIADTGRTPSSYQLGIYRWVVNGSGNAIVEAVPGSGKTTTLDDLCRFIPRDKTILKCAFNKHIADELESRLTAEDRRNQTVATLHSIGLRTINANVRGRIKVYANKVDFIAKDHLGFDKLSKEEIAAAFKTFPAIRKLVSLLKNFGYSVFRSDATTDDIMRLVDQYSVEIPSGPEWDSLLQTIRAVHQLTLARQNGVDFDDMLAIPVKANFDFPQYDFVLVDECQDLNPIQIEMIARLRKADGRVIFVGDRNQAIYGFRGADPYAMNSISEKFDTTPLPLSICWRCPTASIALAQELVPHVEAAPNAIPGIFAVLDEATAQAQVTDGDYMICRTVAPTVQWCLRFLRENRKACVIGRDIAGQLIKLIERIRDDETLTGETPVDRFNEHLSRETDTLKKRNLHFQLSILVDYVETLKFLAQDADNDYGKMVARINQIFSDDDRSGISLSTIHKAKGLEADNVYLLRPDLIPHPKAKRDWERLQERNLKFIADTRNRKALYYVQNPKDDA